MTELERLAETIDEAARRARPVPQFSITRPLSVAEGYAVQTLAIGRRLGRGDRRAGLKMGFTSRAKQVQMGLRDLICGRLTDGMRIADNGTIALTDYIHPRAEPEIAYLVRERMAGHLSALEAMNAIAGVAPAIEIIDSRYADFRFDAGDVLADNTSAAGFVVGRWHAPATDVANLGLVLAINGRAREVGSTAAILGDPARALVAAARMAAELGEALLPGDIVLAGAATAAVELAAGDHVEARFETLGSVGVRVRA
ncbi:MAG: fumarylacetoacetate hydrolase family protein [Rhodobacteraceae bacterium]|nr:fumarylacetoacetate hydrolase family protein [Paracoccaceae bacterium]